MLLLLFNPIFNRYFSTDLTLKSHHSDTIPLYFLLLNSML